MEYIDEFIKCDKKEKIKEEDSMENVSTSSQIKIDTNELYEKYDRLVWDISSKWYSCISLLSKGRLELEDIHNELWTHILKELKKYNEERSNLTSWICLISNSKLGMMKRNLETQKNNALINEENFSINTPLKISNGEKEIEALEMMGVDLGIEEKVVLQESMLDYIYLLLELVDSCTEKERKVYLLKLKGKSQKEIEEEAFVSKSYIPKIYKRLSKKFKQLYYSLDKQPYINKEERDALSKDLLNSEPVDYICEKYELEPETVCICKEIIKIMKLYGR